MFYVLMFVLFYLLVGAIVFVFSCAECFLVLLGAMLLPFWIPGAQRVLRVCFLTHVGAKKASNILCFALMCDLGSCFADSFFLFFCLLALYGTPPSNLTSLRVLRMCFLTHVGAKIASKILLFALMCDFGS